MPKRKRSGKSKRFAKRRRVKKRTKSKRTKTTTVGAGSSARVTNSLTNRRPTFSLRRLKALLNSRGRHWTPKIPLAGASVFPKHMTCKLRSAGSYIGVGDGVAFPFIYKISLNSPFKVNITAGSGQPFGFDQAMAIYEKYIVIRSKVTFFIENFTNAKQKMFLFRDNDNTTELTNTWIEALVSPLTKTMILQESASGADNHTGTFSIVYTPKAIVNQGGIGAENSVYSSFVGTSAADVPNVIAAQLNFQTFADGITPSNALRIDYVVEYTVVFFESKITTPS